MKIVLDALGIHYFGGGRTATLRLLEELFRLDTHNQYLVVLTQPEPSLHTSAGNVSQWIAPMKNRLAVRLWAQAVFPGRLKSFDVIHSIKNLAVFGVTMKSVVTVYDLTTLVYPELFPKIDVWYWRTIQKHTLKQSDRIIAISRNTAQDIQKFYGISSDKISVIYPAHAPHFVEPSAEEILRVRQRYRLPSNFIVHVGRIDRKKNLGLLIKAFAQMYSVRDEKIYLVFVGEAYAKSRDVTLQGLIAHHNLTERVIFTGAVPDEDLPPIYGAARIAVFCSLHEGFGIVALEAMACGTPLIITPAGGVLEAVGNAARIVSPDNSQQLAEAMTDVLHNDEVRQQMRSNGLIQSSHFSWRQAAQQTLQVYQDV